MTILEFFGGVFCTIKGFALACVITLGIITVLKETGLVHAKNIDKPESVVQLTNPLADATTNESGKDAPNPGSNAEAEKEPLISATTTGTGEEFDGTKTRNQPLTWWQKKIARKARKIALNNGWNYAPLEDAEKIGTHLITVVTKGAEAGEFAGIYYRDTPLEEWEKELARALLDLAGENGGEEK